MSVELDSDLARDAAGQELGRAFKAALAAVRRLRGRESHALTPGALSDAQYGVMFCLLDLEQLSTSEVALRAELSPASATEMLEALAAAGLVQRTRSQRDRRVVISTLTERGRELVEARRARFEPRFREAMAPFTPEELRTAAAVLERLRAMFDDIADAR